MLDWIPEWAMRCIFRVILYFIQLLPKRPSQEHEFISKSKKGPIGFDTELSNALYELPPEYFKTFLGPSLKYSCCLFEENSELRTAEERANAFYCTKVGLKDGMSVLDLGAGWGSLSLYIAQNYPNCKIYAVSMSQTATRFIQHENITCKVLDIANCPDDAFDAEFDVIFAIEVFEYFRNYLRLLSKVSNWLKFNGKLFIQAFCHYNKSFHIKTRPGSWTSTFLANGTVPSQNFYSNFQDSLELVDASTVSGMHYSKTFKFWLNNFDNHKEDAIDILNVVYDEKDAEMWYRRWRLALILLEELFAAGNGRVFMVGHYTFNKRQE